MHAAESKCVLDSNLEHDKSLVTKHSNLLQKS